MIEICSGISRYVRAIDIVLVNMKMGVLAAEILREGVDPTTTVPDPQPLPPGPKILLREA